MQVGTLLFTVVVLTVHLELASVLEHWTWLHFFGIAFSICAPQCKAECLTSNFLCLPCKLHRANTSIPFLEKPAWLQSQDMSFHAGCFLLSDMSACRFAISGMELSTKGSTLRKDVLLPDQASGSVRAHLLIHAGLELLARQVIYVPAAPS